MCPSIRKINQKKIEKKINIDLAILPSHDSVTVSSIVYQVTLLSLNNNLCDSEQYY